MSGKRKKKEDEEDQTDKEGGQSQCSDTSSLNTQNSDVALPHTDAVCPGLTPRMRAELALSTVMLGLNTSDPDALETQLAALSPEVRRALRERGIDNLYETKSDVTKGRGWIYDSRKSLENKAAVRAPDTAAASVTDQTGCGGVVRVPARQLLKHCEFDVMGSVHSDESLDEMEIEQWQNGTRAGMYVAHVAIMQLMCVSVVTARQFVFQQEGICSSFERVEGWRVS
jgi:pyruvate/2-oxoglutarate dehydrogenase complex dihydrolipoamide acyltransferase (E2) component